MFVLVAGVVDGPFDLLAGLVEQAEGGIPGFVIGGRFGVFERRVGGRAAEIADRMAGREGTGAKEAGSGCGRVQCMGYRVWCSEYGGAPTNPRRIRQGGPWGRPL